MGQYVGRSHRWACTARTSKLRQLPRSCLDTYRNCLNRFRAASLQCRCTCAARPNRACTLLDSRRRSTGRYTGQSHRWACSLPTSTGCRSVRTRLELYKTRRHQRSHSIRARSLQCQCTWMAGTCTAGPSLACIRLDKWEESTGRYMGPSHKWACTARTSRIRQLPRSWPDLYRNCLNRFRAASLQCQCTSRRRRCRPSRSGTLWTDG